MARIAQHKPMALARHQYRAILARDFSSDDGGRSNDRQHKQPRKNSNKAIRNPVIGAPLKFYVLHLCFLVRSGEAAMSAHG
jgi:hypothetical protein